MKVGIFEVTKVSEICEVQIPESLQTKVEQAMEYVAGYLCQKPNLPEEILAIQAKYGDPARHSQQNDPNLWAYVFGFQSRMNFFGPQKLPINLFHKTIHEHESTLEEIHCGMEANPGFIPGWAWDPDEAMDNEYNRGLIHPRVRKRY